MTGKVVLVTGAQQGIGRAGIGPQRYIIQRRLERAKRLLRRTHLPIALIAQEVGFADQSHLTQMFRREVGVTPGRYRAERA